MKPKKGQITIFIIIAIVLVAIVAMFFLFKGEQSGDKVVDPEIAPISNFIEQCIYNKGEEAIYDISFTGGYFLSSDLSNDLGIPYYYYDGQNNVPTKEQVGEEISLALDSNLILCLNGLEEFTEYEISFGDSQTTTTIEDESVFFDVKFPITITKGNSTNRLEDFNNIEIPVRLGIVYDSISEIISEQTSDGICLSCVTDISLRNDIYVEIIDYDEESSVFEITDENSKLGNQTLEYIFAVKY